MTTWTKYSENIDKFVPLIVLDSVTDIAPTQLIYPDCRGTLGFFTSFKTFKASGVKTVGKAAFVSVVVDEAKRDIHSSLHMLKSIDLPAATIIGDSAFGGCTALESLAFGTALPTLDGSKGIGVFFDAGRDKGFTIFYVPMAQEKTALEVEITDTVSDWYKAFKTTDIGAGWFKEVAIIPQ